MIAEIFEFPAIFACVQNDGFPKFGHIYQTYQPSQFGHETHDFSLYITTAC